MNEPTPPERGRQPRVKGRLPFSAPDASRAAMRQGALVVYGLLTAGLIGLALYMALVQQRPVMSPWVASPAIGAVWFALRLFMIWGSRG